MTGGLTRDLSAFATPSISAPMSEFVVRSRLAKGALRWRFARDLLLTLSRLTASPDNILNLLSCFSAAWLRPAAEAVARERMVADAPDAAAMRRFVDVRLLAPAKFELPPEDGMHPAEAERRREKFGRDSANAFVLKRVLRLILLLDRACLAKLGPVGVTLFDQGASIKSTKVMVRPAHVNSPRVAQAQSSVGECASRADPTPEDIETHSSRLLQLSVPPALHPTQ